MNNFQKQKLSVFLRIIKLTTTVVLATCLSLTANRVVAQAQYTQFEWRIDTSDPSAMAIYPDEQYWLFNNMNDQFIKYGKRKYGINLIWSPDFEPRNITFQRQSGSGPLKYGELLAIHVAGGGYLRYGSQNYGINLVWSSTPVYEWRFMPQYKQAGEVINPNDNWMGLVNATSGKPLSSIGNSRTYGINLFWSDFQLPTQAGVSFNFVKPSDGVCKDSVVWYLYPVNLTGSDGYDRNHTVYLTNGGVQDGLCRYFGYPQDPSGQIGIGLKTGTWQVDMLSTTKDASCQVFLGRERNTVEFNERNNGCIYLFTH